MATENASDSSIFMDGRDARIRGVPHSANPFERHSDNYEIWLQGWEDGADAADDPTDNIDQETD